MDVSFINQLRAIIKEEMETVNKTINDRFNELENKFEEIQEVKEDIASVKIKIRKLEGENRKRNLLFVGLGTFNNSKERDDHVMDLINNQMKIKCQSHDIDFIRAVINNNELTSKRNGTLIVGFTTFRKKIEILNSRRNLKGTEIHMFEDFDKETRETRKRLFPIMMEERQKGNYAILKMDKLIVNGKEWTTAEEYRALEDEGEKEEESKQNGKRKFGKIVGPPGLSQRRKISKGTAQQQITSFLHGTTPDKTGGEETSTEDRKEKVGTNNSLRKLVSEENK